MNSFIENVNYVANLDNKYGSSIEIYKNNLLPIFWGDPEVLDNF